MEDNFIKPVPEDQQYTLHGRIEADIAKHLEQIDWDNDHFSCKFLLSDDKDRLNYQHAQKLKSVGLVNANTNMRQKRMKDENDPAQSFFIRCAKATRLKDVEILVCRQPPGNLTPWHTDYFISYRDRNNYNDVPKETVHELFRRYWMPLEDWKSGHFYQSNRATFWGWKAGDLYSGPSDTPHLAGNAGTETRYFAQITGFMKDIDYLGKNGFETVEID